MSNASSNTQLANWKRQGPVRDIESKKKLNYIMYRDFWHDWKEGSGRVKEGWCNGDEGNGGQWGQCKGCCNRFFLSPVVCLLLGQKHHSNIPKKGVMGQALPRNFRGQMRMSMMGWSWSRYEQFRNGKGAQFPVGCVVWWDDRWIFSPNMWNIPKEKPQLGLSPSAHISLFITMFTYVLEFSVIWFR